MQAHRRAQGAHLIGSDPSGATLGRCISANRSVTQSTEESDLEVSFATDAVRAYLLGCLGAERVRVERNEDVRGVMPRSGRKGWYLAGAVTALSARALAFESKDEPRRRRGRPLAAIVGQRTPLRTSQKKTRAATGAPIQSQESVDESATATSLRVLSIPMT